MNRFFRSALFPLIVIVLLVYLASQTLLPKSKAPEKATLSQAIDRIKNDPGLDSEGRDLADGQEHRGRSRSS